MVHRRHDHRLPAGHRAGVHRPAETDRGAVAIGCSCGGARAAARARVEVLGYTVTYPDGTVSDPPFLTPMEARREIMRAGGGTMRRITRKTR